MKPALILFAHGSRDPEWAIPFRAVQQKLAEKKPELVVAIAYLELMQPSLSDAVGQLVAAGAQRITIAPLFMAQGTHLKRDLSRLIADLRELHTGVELTLLPAVGEVEVITDAMSTWLAAHA